ncbi:DUF4340 domain-containing protein [Salinisphaera aquimarina]|uniref:DUF4340 domain-containing protein n=1 Tax=Salinisphaera aquimarina TaxID=2094031 RepID=A0ABV7EW19_9GAMM
MRKRIIFNVVLILGVVALGAALWFTRPGPPPARETVSALAPGEISHIEVHTRDNVIELARDEDNGRWRMIEPAQARADATRIAALLELAARTPEHRYARDAVAADKTGVDDADLTLRFNDEAPIAIGHEGPSPGTRYVRTAHALLLVKSGHLEEQPLGWTRWIAPGLLAADARLTRLTLPRATLTRSDNGGWQVVPANADRGADYAQATIDAWHYSRALAVEPLDASRERIARVTLQFADEPARHLDVIARAPELVLRDAALGVDYHMAANQAGPLLDMQHPDILRQSRGNDLQPSAIPLTDPGANTEPPAEGSSSAN